MQMSVNDRKTSHGRPSVYLGYNGCFCPRAAGFETRRAKENPIVNKVLYVLFLLASGLSAHADSVSIDDAGVAATEFLALVDKREYDKSYSTASQVLRDEVSKEEWMAHVGNLRGPLGQLNQRTVNSSEFHESLPEAPPGEYVIFTFDSSFENNKSAAEVVAVTKGSDGVWRVVGYYFG